MVYSTKKKDEEEWIDLHGKRKKKWQEPKKKQRNEWSRERNFGGKFRETEGSHTLSFFRREVQRQRTLQNCGGFQIPSNHAHDILHKPPRSVPKFLQHISTYNEKMSSAFFKLFFFIERSCILYSSIHRHLFGIVSLSLCIIIFLPLYKK